MRLRTFAEDLATPDDRVELMISSDVIEKRRGDTERDGASRVARRPHATGRSRRRRRAPTGASGAVQVCSSTGSPKGDAQNVARANFRSEHAVRAAAEGHIAWACGASSLPLPRVFAVRRIDPRRRRRGRHLRRRDQEPDRRNAGRRRGRGGGGELQPLSGDRRRQPNSDTQRTAVSPAYSTPHDAPWTALPRRGTPELMRSLQCGGHARSPRDSRSRGSGSPSHVYTRPADLAAYAYDAWGASGERHLPDAVVFPAIHRGGRRAWSASAPSTGFRSCPAGRAPATRPAHRHARWRHPQPRPSEPDPRPRVRSAPDPCPGGRHHRRHPPAGRCGRPVLPAGPRVVVDLHDRRQRRLQRCRPAHAAIRRDGRLRGRHHRGALRRTDRPRSARAAIPRRPACFRSWWAPRGRSA